jgi:SnoaL-like domain
MKEVSAQDYVEILNLYARYNLCSDAGDADGYADCFSSKGKLDVLTPGPSLSLTGRENFVAFKAREAGSRRHIYRRHWNGSIHLERVDDHTVIGRCYFLAYNGTPGALPAIADSGVYKDRLVKEAGHWKFEHRHLTLDAASAAVQSSR